MLTDFLFNAGGNLNAASRQALMQKLARIDPPPIQLPTVYAFGCFPVVQISDSDILLSPQRQTYHYADHDF